jgi:hypothetical protein
MPSAEVVSYWSCVFTAIRILIFLIFTQFGCDHGDVILGNTPQSTSDPMPTDLHLFSNCSADCDCKSGPIIPLCDEYSGRLFYSPCHAGCEQILDNGTVFADCSCLPANSTLTSGFCEGHGGCGAGFVTFLILVALGEFLGSSGVVGKMMIFYRYFYNQVNPMLHSLIMLIQRNNTKLMMNDI